MGKTVLIVDDNPDMSTLLSEMLEVFDVASERAADGSQALHALENGKFSMLITDMRMPNMTGLELIEQVKKQYPRMPAVLISGYSVNMVEGEENGTRPDGFLTKPFLMSDIERLIERHLT